VAALLQEKIMSKRWHLNKNKLLTNLQYGFRNNASTELAVSAIYEGFLETWIRVKAHVLFFSI